MLKVPEINQVVELEEMGGEEGGDEGDPDPEAASGNQEAEVLEGNHVQSNKTEKGESKLCNQKPVEATSGLLTH